MDEILGRVRAFSNTEAGAQDLIEVMDQKLKHLNLETIYRFIDECLRLDEAIWRKRWIGDVFQHMLLQVPRLFLGNFKEILNRVGERDNTSVFVDIRFTGYYGVISELLSQIAAQHPNLQGKVLACADQLAGSLNYYKQNLALSYYETCFVWYPESITRSRIRILSQLMLESMDQRRIRLFARICEKTSEFIYIHRKLYTVIGGLEGNTRLQMLREFLLGTPWFVEDNVIDKIREFIRSEPPSHDTISLLQTIIDCSPKFTTLCFPYIIELLQDPAQIIQEKALKLVKTFISVVSRFLGDLALSKHPYQTSVDGTWKEYGSLMARLPKYLGKAGLETIKEHLRSHDSEIQFIALILLELLINYSPIRVTINLVKTLEIVAIQSAPPAQCTTLRILSDILEVNPSIVNQSMVQIFRQVLQEEVSEEESESLRDFVEVNNNFLYQFSLWWLCDLISAWSKHALGLVAYRRVLEKVPQFMDQGGIRACLNFLVSDEAMLREEAFLIWKMVREKFPEYFEKHPKVIPSILRLTTCPECGKPLIEAVVRGLSLPYNLKSRSWVDLSVEELKQRMPFYCFTCHKPVPLASLPADIQAYWEAKLLEKKAGQLEIMSL